MCSGSLFCAKVEVEQNLSQKERLQAEQTDPDGYVGHGSAPLVERLVE